MLASVLRRELTSAELGVVASVLEIPDDRVDMERTRWGWRDGGFVLEVIARASRHCPFQIAWCRRADRLMLSWGIGDRDPVGFVGGITHEDVTTDVGFREWVTSDFDRFLRACVDRTITRDARGRPIRQRYVLRDVGDRFAYASEPYTHRWVFPWTRLQDEVIHYPPWLP